MKTADELYIYHSSLIWFSMSSSPSTSNSKAKGPSAKSTTTNLLHQHSPTPRKSKEEQGLGQRDSKPIGLPLSASKPTSTTSKITTVATKTIASSSPSVAKTATNNKPPDQKQTKIPPVTLVRRNPPKVSLLRESSSIEFVGKMAGNSKNVKNEQTTKNQSPPKPTASAPLGGPPKSDVKGQIQKPGIGGASKPKTVSTSTIVSQQQANRAILPAVNSKDTTEKPQVPPIPLASKEGSIALKKDVAKPKAPATTAGKQTPKPNGKAAVKTQLTKAVGNKPQVGVQSAKIETQVPVSSVSATPHKNDIITIPFPLVQLSPAPTTNQTNKSSVEQGVTKEKNLLLSRRSIGSSVGSISSAQSAKVLFKPPPEWNVPENEGVATFLHSHRPLAIEREEEGRKSQTEASKNLSALNFQKVRYGKEEQSFVTVLPADEKKIVELEINSWKRSKRFFLLLFILTVGVGLAIIVFTLVSAILYFKEKSTFILHTDFMILVNTILSALGILVFRLLPQKSKECVVGAHVVIFALFYIAMGVGYAIAFIKHEAVTGRKEHMYTMHSLTGSLIFVFLVTEIFSGIYLMFRPTNVEMKKVHSSIGSVTFMLCGACCLSGYIVRTAGFKGPQTLTRSFLTFVNAVLIITFTFLVRYISTDFRFRRRRCPEWDMVVLRSPIPKAEEQSLLAIGGISLQEFARKNLKYTRAPS